MENGSEPAPKPDVDSFVEDMLTHAQELHTVLRKEGDKNDIKDRITCLKYLEDVMKTYFLLKKATTHDPDAAGSTVRKYAAAFKGPTGVGAPRKRGRPAAKFAPAPDLESDDLGGDEPDHAA